MPDVGHKQLFATELSKRMDLPQRHRLLHGYPMAPLMEPCQPKLRRFSGFEQEQRDLIIGVLPHPFCNPRVKGCGFCTFPHAAFNKEGAQRTCAAVVEEIEALREAHPELCQRRVEAVYLGGGTANLTPWPELAAIIASLQENFALEQSELTLEGVPIYFAVKDFELLDRLEALEGLRHKRISMGVQSFEPQWLQKMGREAFGDGDTITSIVKAAQQRQLSTSCDLLCNLPGQEFALMQRDVERAIDIGFEQICLYHLVLFSGLNVPWAEDPTMLASLPPNPVAFENWQRLRELLLEGGYVQTTLTNFERADIHKSERRFRYETASFTPLKYDGLGFGPGAISSLLKWSGGSLTDKFFVKLLNPGEPETYIQNVDQYKTGHDRRFHGIDIDSALLFLTRSLATTRFDLADYKQLSPDRPGENFYEAWDLLCDQKLLIEKGNDVQFSVKGMFYADSVVGLLAWPRTQTLRGLEGRAAELGQEQLASFGAHSPMG